MPVRTFALLVGINDYGPNVGALRGCLADVDLLHAYLRQQVDPQTLAVEVLKDNRATRANIIERFRSHLGQAGAGDVALFQFCGHGAQWASHAAFREFFPDGKDEGLVCFDSRQPGGYDLADKELAVLIAEVASRDAHVAVLLDCCHSGSGTRGADAFLGLTPRLTHEVTTERPLESYLDGYYARLRAEGQRLSIPTARHILLSACERGQLAQEARGHGVFTSTLVDVLKQSGSNLSYADLFVRCRAAVRSRAFDQDPQLEAYGRFDAHAGFLARPMARTERGRYMVSCKDGQWTVECGALNGLSTASTSVPTLALYEDGGSTPVGTARAVKVGAQQSPIELEFDIPESRPESRPYFAEITSLPEAPLPVAFAGDDTIRDAVQRVFDERGVPVQLVGAREAARYALTSREGRMTLAPTDRDLTIGYALLTGSATEVAPALAVALAPAVRTVADWERTLALRNRRSALDPADVDFVYDDEPEGGAPHTFTDGSAILDYVLESDTTWRLIRGRFKARNRSGQSLHLALLYFSEEFGVSEQHNEQLAPGAGWMELWGSGLNHSFYLPNGVDESIERFKLIVSTEKIDSFLVPLPALTLGKEYPVTRAMGSGTENERTRSVAQTNEWFTKDFTIRVVRRVDRVSASDTTVAGGQIVVKGHPTLDANISLSGAGASARGAGPTAGFHQALAQHGMTLVNFSATRGSELSVLELTDIQNAEALREQPLELEVKVTLETDEAILPVVFDGEHVLLGGVSQKQDDGTTRIVIDHIPEADDERRSLGGSLKLYFFKTVLRRARVNSLRWVDFTADTITYHTDDVAAKVAGARRVLLLMHGITGDTEGMAEGVRDCGLDRCFDLVLAYDYENLATSIEDTARALKLQLAEAGLSDGDNRHLTLLVHSMGGLVSRWFIEREGGHRVVDHLVMCGTPNHGSPLGRIEDARKIVSVMMTLAMNYLPATVSLLGPALFVLNATRNLTPTLEQMDPASEFIRLLNASDDPGVPYTILAGDVATYQEAGDRLFAKLVAKAGKSVAFDTLFADQANDMAVGVESILGIADERRTPPARQQVACHHMNYFVSTPGQQALKLVAW